MTYEQHAENNSSLSGSNSEQGSLSIDELLNRAKFNIEIGEDRWRQAAEDIASASEQGATQRKIAQTVGKSVAWINALLKWRSAGYTDTAFGPQSKASRARRAAAHVQAPEQAKTKPRPASTSEQAQMTAAQAEAAKAKADAATAKARAQQAKAEAVEAKARARHAKAEAAEAVFNRMSGRSKKEIHSSHRTLLIKALGMLGSEQDGECLAAARKAEQLRKKLKMDWNDLIVEATEGK